MFSRDSVEVLKGWLVLSLLRSLLLQGRGEAGPDCELCCSPPALLLLLLLLSSWSGGGAGGADGAGGLPHVGRRTCS